MNEADCEIRRLIATDPQASREARRLEAFHRSLSMDSLRLFRPMGWDPAPEQFHEIVADNAPDGGTKFDLVALDGDGIVGWSFAWRLDSAEPTFGVCVAERQRRRGLGGRLMDAVLAEIDRRGLPKLLLTVVSDNEVARAMYERRGFVAYDRKVNDEDGQEYIHMARAYGGGVGR